MWEWAGQSDIPFRPSVHLSHLTVCSLEVSTTSDGFPASSQPSTAAPEDRRSSSRQETQLLACTEKVAYKPVLDPEQKGEFRESLMIACLGNQPKLLYNLLRILWQKDAETHSPGQQGPGRSVWAESTATVSSLAHTANERACACQAGCGGSTRLLLP